MAVFCRLAQVAQSVEQRTENPRVDGSIPPLGTMNSKGSDLFGAFFMPDVFGCLGIIPVHPDDFTTPINAKVVMLTEYDYVNIRFK